MSGYLLRRPLPPLKKESKSGKSNTITDKYKAKLQHYEEINKKRPYCHSFDIFEDGDRNLMKPLGPQPFFSTKWHAKTKPVLESQHHDLSYLHWPPMSTALELLNPISSGKDSDDENDEFVNEFKEEQKNLRVSQKQDAIHIINIENNNLPNIVLKKPWRQNLLEQAEFKGDNELNEQNDIDLIGPSITNHGLSLQYRHGNSIGSDAWKKETKTSDSPNRIISERLHSSRASTCEEVDQFPSNETLETQVELKEDEVEELYQQAKNEIEGNLEGFPSVEITMKEEVDYETTEEHTKLNLKAQFLDLIPDFSPAVMTTLTWVNLSFNDFVDVPSQIFQAINLVYLNMRNNPLFDIPDEISMLKKLKYANFSFCCIHEVNEKFFDLKELEILDLSYNHIVEVSPRIKQLQSLKELYIEGNQIRTLPKNILKLKLSYFHASSNFLNKAFWGESCPTIVQSLFELSVNTILSYGVKNRRDMKTQFGMVLSSTKCDNCNGPKPFYGVPVLKPVIEMFGVKNVPIMFSVCSQSCRKQLLNASQLPYFDDDDYDGDDHEDKDEVEDVNCDDKMFEAIEELNLQITREL